MSRIITEGNTLNEALTNAMLELSTTSDNIEYTVLQEGSGGFFGLGSKKYKIEAYRKDDKEEVYKENSKNKEEKLVENEEGIYEFKTENKKSENSNKEIIRNYEEVFEKVKEFLLPIFKEFNTQINIEYDIDKANNVITFDLSGEKMGLIIGKHGQTLDSLQHLCNIIVNNGREDKIKINIDSQNYREKRYKTLEALAKSVANNVIKTKKSYELEPMPSYERKIIHSILQKKKNIETISIGEDKNRHIIIKYRK